ncbi:inhibitor of growth protein [Anaeramoeba flamelloides]|uniref:Inhibitor of growth protein n=1 Tax=Anaeramoeba flamelloides TaxID=1746091 RepID=A0AAV7YH23_9EUKA|nr:inhibitor of growth protein [Anaeramoeba flamelloides]
MDYWSITTILAEEEFQQIKFLQTSKSVHHILDNFKLKIKANQMKSNGNEKSKSSLSSEESESESESDNEMLYKEEHNPMWCCGKEIEDDYIKCDNPLCKKQWYHFRCVNLKEVPNTNWYCPSCLENQASSQRQQQEQEEGGEEGVSGHQYGSKDNSFSNNDPNDLAIGTTCQVPVWLGEVWKKKGIIELLLPSKPFNSLAKENGYPISMPLVEQNDYWYFMKLSEICNQPNVDFAKFLFQIFSSRFFSIIEHSLQIAKQLLLPIRSPFFTFSDSPTIILQQREKHTDIDNSEMIQKNFKRISTIKAGTQSVPRSSSDISFNLSVKKSVYNYFYDQDKFIKNFPNLERIVYLFGIDNYFRLLNWKNNKF